MLAFSETSVFIFEELVGMLETNAFKFLILRGRNWNYFAYM